MPENQTLSGLKATQRKLLVSQALPLPFLGTAFSLFIANRSSKVELNYHKKLSEKGNKQNNS